MRITRGMYGVLKLSLQGFRTHEIARQLRMHPSDVSRILPVAVENFEEVNKMLTELKALGWPMTLEEIKQQTRIKAQGRKRH